MWFKNLILNQNKNTISCIHLHLFIAMKLYPKTLVDKSGIKFVFDSKYTHYTIRFAWKPLTIIEQLYIELWWEDFYTNYKALKERKPIDESNKAKLEVAMKMVHTLLNAMNNSEAAPLVVYKHPRFTTRTKS